MYKCSNQINIASSVFRIFCLVAIAILSQSALLQAQTPVKSSREERLRRIEEHRQIRQRTLELSQDLRGVHLTPQQRSEIRQVLRRYNTSTGTSRREPNSDGPTTESVGGGCGPGATQPPVAERMRAEVLQLLTSEQSDKLNAIKQEREDRAQKAPDFQVRKKP